MTRGAPSVLQMLLGRPQLLTNYDKLVHGQKRGLLIFLKNPPLGKSFWRRLGVRRDTIASLSASFCITEVGTNKVMTKPLMHARIYSDDDPTETGSWRIALPPTLHWSTNIMIAMWDDTKKKAITPPDRLRNPLELSSGTYRLEVIFLVEGQPRKEFRRFVVGVNADDLVWIKPTQSISHKEGSQT